MIYWCNNYSQVRKCKPVQTDSLCHCCATATRRARAKRLFPNSNGEHYYVCVCVCVCVFKIKNFQQLGAKQKLRWLANSWQDYLILQIESLRYVIWLFLLCTGISTCAEASKDKVEVLCFQLRTLGKCLLAPKSTSPPLWRKSSLNLNAINTTTMLFDSSLKFEIDLLSSMSVTKLHYYTDCSDMLRVKECGLCGSADFVQQISKHRKDVASRISCDEKWKCQLTQLI